LPSDCGLVGIAKPSSRFNERLQHSLQIKRRSTYDLEHVGSGGLLLQGFTKLIEETRVFDSNNGLCCEVFYQLDLPMRKRPHLLAVDNEGADQLIFLQHRNRNNGTCSTICGCRTWGRPCLLVGKVNNRLFSKHSGKYFAYILWPEWATPCLKFDKLGRRANARNSMKQVAIVAKNRAELGLADTGGILEHDLKYRF
jgi:hypothetical protein